MRKWRLIFDYDDTIIKHNTSIELVYMAEYLKMEYNEEFIRQLTSFYSHMSSWSAKGKVTEEKFERCLFTEAPIFFEKGIGVREFLKAERYKDSKVNLTVEGVHELFEYLISNNYYLCILTNGFYNEQVESLKYQGLVQYFEKIYAWDNFYAKPDERAFLRALNGTDPIENIMIGNNIAHDILPAKKIGIYTFGVNLNKADYELGLPDIELNQLLELKSFL